MLGRCDGIWKGFKRSWGATEPLKEIKLRENTTCLGFRETELWQWFHDDLEEAGLKSRRPARRLVC